jgi:hypothetical protein
VPQVYFQYFNKEVLVDRRGAVVDDLAKAHDQVACVVRSLTTARSLKTSAAGSCTSKTVSVMSSSSSTSLSCCASRIEVAMFVVRSPIALLGRCVLGIKRRCIKLIATACDRYRPERHYMRGPGPKWFAKHGVVPIGPSLEARQVRAHGMLASESISSRRSNRQPIHEEVKVIVPSDSRLEIEAMVSNRDIGFVHPGENAEITNIRRRDRVKEKVAVG